MVRKIIATTTFAAAALSLSACNTIDGIEEDAESVVEEVDEEI